MPGYLVDQNAQVLCSHGGQALATAPFPRVTVSNGMVATLSGPYSIAGCPFTTGASPQPCITGQWLTAATRVRAGGQPVVLADSQSLCTPNGTPMAIVGTQVRVRGQ